MTVTRKGTPRSLRAAFFVSVHSVHESAKRAVHELNWENTRPLVSGLRIGETVMTDPVKDLWPVCPNCHALIHSKGQDEEYTMAEAREIVLQAHH